MKKWIKLLIVFILLFSTPAMAAWTVVATIDDTPMDWRNGQQMYTIKFACTSDASASGDIVLSTFLIANYGAEKAQNFMTSIMGGLLYAVKYEPSGGANDPTSESTITVEDEVGWVFFSEAVTTAATPQGFDGTVDSGFGVPIVDITLTFTTLANTKVANFYVYIVR